MPRCVQESRKLVASVVIPIFNDSRHLLPLLASLYRQDIRDFEVIIVDDCSTDDTPATLRSLQRKYPFKVISSPRNMGSGFCRNLGSKESKAEILAFIDSDCVADEDWLRTLLGPIMDGSADATYGPNYIPLRETRSCKLESIRAMQYRGMDTKNMAIRREVFFALGGFREDITLNVDWEFHQRFVRAGYRLVRTEAVVRHDFPDDPIRTILKTRRRGREEAKLLGKDRAAARAVRTAASRMLRKIRNTPTIWKASGGGFDALAAVVYYLLFHASWNASYLIHGVLMRRG